MLYHIACWNLPLFYLIDFHNYMKTLITGGVIIDCLSSCYLEMLIRKMSWKIHKTSEKFTRKCLWREFLFSKVSYYRDIEPNIKEIRHRCFIHCKICKIFLKRLWSWIASTRNYYWYVALVTCWEVCLHLKITANLFNKS